MPSAALVDELLMFDRKLDPSLNEDGAMESFLGGTAKLSSSDSNVPFRSAERLRLADLIMSLKERSSFNGAVLKPATSPA